MENWKELLNSNDFDMKTVEYCFDLYFNGAKNIITPETVRYDALFTRSRVVLFEITTNNVETLFGVTTLCFDRTTQELQRIDLNKLVDTLDDANKYIRTLTFGSIDSGDLYGKKI